MLSASSAPYRSARHPTATTLAPVSVAASSVSTESFFADSTNPHVFTTTTSAPVSPPSTSSHPPALRRPANSAEATSLRAHPSVSSATRRDDGGGDTPKE